MRLTLSLSWLLVLALGAFPVPASACATTAHDCPCSTPTSSTSCGGCCDAPDATDPHDAQPTRDACDVTPGLATCDCRGESTAPDAATIPSTVEDARPDRGGDAAVDLPGFTSRQDGDAHLWSSLHDAGTPHPVGVPGRSVLCVWRL